MTGVILCFLALVSCYIASKRSRGSGLAAVLTWGYAYGMLRAYFADSGAYFVFDSALAGLYLAHFFRPGSQVDRQRTGDLRLWAIVLILWPVLMLLLPFQPILVSLVGLRASILALPVMLVASELTDEDLYRISKVVSLLNIVIVTVALLEYRFGLENFFPRNNVTTLMFDMNDVANHTAYRIPATFSQAHVYAGTMVCTIPILFGAWIQPNRPRGMRTSVICGVAAALLGVLLAAARIAFISAALITAFGSLKRGGLQRHHRRAWLAMLAGIVILAATNERLQRFTSLTDTESVETRIAGSVNRRFSEILVEYPMGNGLGGGGTSIPYFLERFVNHPIALESEYARILLEQSAIGLVIWIAFIIWVFTRSTAFVTTAWRGGRRLAWFTCLLCFCSGLIGIGMFTAIPQTVLIFMMIGWFSVRPPRRTNNIFIAINGVSTVRQDTPSSCVVGRDPAMG